MRAANSHFGKHYINGVWTTPKGAMIDVENPATREIFARVPNGTSEEVDAAVAAAQSAFPRWRSTPLAKRIELMEGMLRRFCEKTEDVIELEVAELGAPVAFARSKHCLYQQKRTAAFIAAARSIAAEEAFPASLVMREPVGVVAAITPWNYPLGQIIQKVVPALLMGCTVVLKPSEWTPLTAVLLIEAFEEAGFPPGVLNLVQGYGETVGEAMTGHAGVDLISFTGSTAIGRRIAGRAAPMMKRLILELGGKSAAVWLPELEGHEAGRMAAKKVLDSLLLNAGQTCTALSRFLVPAEKLQTAEALLKSVLADYPMGDPTDPATRMGPLISGAQFERVREYIASGIREGARLVAGGLPPEPGADDGWFVPPVVFSDVRPEMRIAQEEIFGPVLSVMPYNTLEEALAIADGTQYGLCGAVFGPHEAAVNFARRMRTGNVYVNDASRDLAAPFGGFKSSGVGREGGVFGLLEFTEPKAIFEHGS